MRWEHRIAFTSITKAIQRLISDLLNRRERWYQDQEIPYSSDELREEIIDRSPHFVLEELITNAFDAYVAEHAEGPIELRISRWGDHVVIEVSDNGVGINEVSRNSDGGLDFRSYLPKPGAQMHKRQGGKRIAIDWANILMHLHGGSLEAWTPGIHGYKTTVRVTLPSHSIHFDIQSDASLAKELSSSHAQENPIPVIWTGKPLGMRRHLETAA
jgi:signal transduction histidine kinase